MKSKYTIPGLLATASRRAPVVVSGRAFSRLRQEASATERALLSNAARLGAIVVTPLLASQADKLTGANTQYSCLAHRLSPAQQHNLRAGHYTLGRIASQTREPDYKADKAVRKLGISRLQAALDRATAPAPTGYVRHLNGNGAGLPARAAYER